VKPRLAETAMKLFQLLKEFRNYFKIIWATLIRICVIYMCS